MGGTRKIFLWTVSLALGRSVGLTQLLLILIHYLFE
jgi:hypothetical protein